MDKSDVGRIENASMIAWPAPEVTHIGGWVLRHADGYSKRANSVQPTGLPSLPRTDVVTRCETWYAERGRPCIFRFTPLSDPGLETYLEAAGYGFLDRTAVLHKPLGRGDGTRESRLRPAQLNQWLETYAQMSGMRGGPPQGLRRIVGSINAGRHLVTLPGRPEHPDPVACGMAVVEGRLVGLFDLVTDPERRRQGFGMELVRGLLAWGVAQGASEAYLQVMYRNEPAMALYRRLGFRHAYDYWYRVQPGERGRGSPDEC